ncbi:MAG: hypothetical protein ACI8ZF_001030 [Candidatus Midichloriaceae bacterium]|jgi:hypothetical protein
MPKQGGYPQESTKCQELHEKKSNDNYNNKRLGAKLWKVKK